MDTQLAQLGTDIFKGIGIGAVETFSVSTAQGRKALQPLLDHLALDQVRTQAIQVKAPRIIRQLCRCPIANRRAAIVDQPLHQIRNVGHYIVFSIPAKVSRSVAIAAFSYFRAS